MKSVIRHVIDHDIQYNALAFICPGCLVMEGRHGTGLHMLPVNSNVKTPSWTWDGDSLLPTLTPSILTKWKGAGLEVVCHSFLTEGVFNFLSDCTHSLVGKKVEMVDLPDWFIKETNE